MRERSCGVWRWRRERLVGSAYSPARASVMEAIRTATTEDSEKEIEGVKRWY
jgi:hypothetical protein